MIADCFDHLQDPRRAQGRMHRLDHILVIALCALIAGADGWDEIATFARLKHPWFARHLDLKHGVPSADTFRRVFAAIAPEAFARGFARWTGHVARKTNGEVVAIDGKTLRRAYDKDDPQAKLHMVSAWAASQRLVLAQQATEAKSNEITAIPALLSVLDLAGCIVTIDAMGTQTSLAQQIREQGADYVLALKGNQKTLYDDVRSYFEETRPESTSAALVHAQTRDLGHGRREVRRVRASQDVAWLSKSEQWQDLRSIVEVEAERHTGEGQSTERRYFISSLPAASDADAEALLSAIRTHWGIENSVHWVLDVVFREDESRIRRDHGGVNLSTLRHLSLNLLRQNAARQTPRSKLPMSVRMKRKRAGWDDDFLAEVVGI